MPKIKEQAANEAKLGASRLRILDGKILLGIDPGDIHVGVAAFAEDRDGWPRCEWAREMEHDEATDFIVRQVSAYTVFGISLERFNLYEDQKDNQVGSEFKTCEQIGVIKFIVRVNNENTGLTGDQDNGDPWSPPFVRLWLQGADIKKPTRAQMKARGIERITPVGSHHGDAEEHGWHRILRGEGGQ